MTVETPDDLAAMFDVDDWATDVTYTPAGGSPIAVVAIIDRGLVGESRDGVSVARRRLTAMVRASDVATPVAGDEISYGGDDYTVYPEGLDEIEVVWTLALQKVAA
jgi:hypothetical protein